MRFFQLVKFEFSNQQGRVSPSPFHKTERIINNIPEIQLDNCFATADVWFDKPRLRYSGNLSSVGPRPGAGRSVKKRAFNALIAIAMLVLSVHGIGLIWLRLAAEKMPPAQPLAMEIKIIPVSAPKPKVAPPPPPPPAAAKIKPQPKKIQPKPVLKKMPVVREPAEFAIKQQVSETLPVEQNTLPASTTEPVPPAKIEPFIEADISVDYAENPKPEYPSMARVMGWQGKVLLRVQVSEEGLSSTVEIEHSSGYEVLDESAADAVKQWRFNPAKRGATPVASTVLVPIIFTLQDQEESR